MDVAPFSPNADPTTDASPRTSRFLVVVSAGRPGYGGPMFRYRLRSTDGDDLGESTYAVPITPGEEIVAGNGMRFHVLDVVAFEDEAEPFVVLSPFVGLLQVEAAQPVAV